MASTTRTITKTVCDGCGVQISAKDDFFRLEKIGYDDDEGCYCRGAAFDLCGDCVFDVALKMKMSAERLKKVAGVTT